MPIWKAWWTYALVRDYWEYLWIKQNTVLAKAWLMPFYSWNSKLQVIYACCFLSIIQSPPTIRTACSDHQQLRLWPLHGPTSVSSDDNNRCASDQMLNENSSAKKTFFHFLHDCNGMFMKDGSSLSSLKQLIHHQISVRIRIKPVQQINAKCLL